MIDTKQYTDLLCSLIAVPSLSGNEDGTAKIIESFLKEQAVVVSRVGNNIIARYSNTEKNSRRPVVLLNSHHDTVKPSQSYTRDPFTPTIDGDKLYGLGSNDAGASLVSLIATFLYFKDKKLPFDIVLGISAQEENSGPGGMRLLWPELGHIDMGIVGEPTGLRVAIGERGLLVLDCVAHGRSGHAARQEGDNAIYRAIRDIEKLKSFPFQRQSSLLGSIGINVTMINAGTQHNVIPDQCNFTVDVRTTDVYTNTETVEIINSELESDVTPRSTHLNASAIDENHLLVRAAMEAGCETFLSPTMSDMALLPIPTIKIGPGDSARSHTADEYILLSEIESGIKCYISIIENLNKLL